MAHVGHRSNCLRIPLNFFKNIVLSAKFECCCTNIVVLGKILRINHGTYSLDPLLLIPIRWYVNNCQETDWLGLTTALFEWSSPNLGDICFGIFTQGAPPSARSSFTDECQTLPAKLGWNALAVLELMMENQISQIVTIFDLKTKVPTKPGW